MSVKCLTLDLAWSILIIFLVSMFISLTFLHFSADTNCLCLLNAQAKCLLFQRAQSQLQNCDIFEAKDKKLKSLKTVHLFVSLRLQTTDIQSIDRWAVFTTLHFLCNFQMGPICLTFHMTMHYLGLSEINILAYWAFCKLLR